MECVAVFFQGKGVVDYFGYEQKETFLLGCWDVKSA
jgi:hypothetical protein